MDPTILAERRATAQQRIVKAATTIRGKLDIAGPVAAREAARHRDLQIETLRQSEAVADLLEAIVVEVGKTPSKPSKPSKPSGDAA
jgi:hypothetical protein